MFKFQAQMISQQKKRLSLKLHQFILLSNSISANQRLYRRYTVTSRGRVDFYFTKYHFDYWQDVWRIEIDIRYADTIIADLIGYFDQIGIYVLDAEVATLRQGNGLTASFVCDLTKYESDIELATDDRYKSGTLELPFLQSLLTERLFDDLWFDHDFGPRVRVSRMRAYHRMKSRYITGRTIVFGNEGFLRNGCIIFDSQDLLKIRDLLFADAPRSDMLCLVYSDTKERIIRVSFLGKVDEEIVLLKVRYRSDRLILSGLLKCFSTRGVKILELDVVAGQTGRPGNRTMHVSGSDQCWSIARMVALVARDMENWFVIRDRVRGQFGDDASVERVESLY